MFVIPAIDLRDGKVVRWVRGDESQEIVYSDDPVSFAKSYEDSGAKWLHVIDLQGAISGNQSNLGVLREIRQQTSMKIECGGGIRTQENILTLIDCGIDRVIIGTKALDQEFISAAVKNIGEKLAVSLDCREGYVSIDGWINQSDVLATAMIPILESLGVSTMVYTNIKHDGMLQGPDTEGLKKVLAVTKQMNVIASGGISSIADLKSLHMLNHPNLFGVITGRALYENKFNLKEALNVIQS